MSVIDSRACWNIGNGQRVKMLGDNWFLGQAEFEVWSPASTLVIRLIEDDANNGNCINSFKFFMAYKGALMIGDELLLQGLKMCKSLGALAMVHAENGDAVDEGQKKMIELGITGPEGHALSRPPVEENLEEVIALTVI
ncbi:hypothetical protein KIW84_075965 [Lathyrus oleraceus]|nr:hypothetical protein KIW84_075965 [Pisum sativum]